MDIDKDNSHVGKLKMEDLPIDVQYEILRRIDDDQTMNNAMEVCQLWRSIIDEWIGVVVHATGRKIRKPGSKCPCKHDLEILSEVGVRKLHIKHGGMCGGLLSHLPNPLPSFKRPRLLRILILERSIHPNLFTSLVTGTVNLSMFVVSSSVLTHLSTENLKCLQFPKLLDLVVESRPDYYGGGDSTLAHLRTLLKENHFPPLKRLKIEFTADVFQELETTRFLFQFIQRHRAMKDLHVKMIVTSSEGDPPNRIEDVYNSIVAELQKPVCCPSLKVINLKVDTINDPCPQLKLWKEFLKQLSSLEKMDLAICPIESFLLKTISSRNGRTLREITIDQFRTYLVPAESFDLNVFSTLECARTLKILGSRTITGATGLPRTLESIFCRGIMSSDDVDHILLELPNLREISLWNVLNGEEGYAFREKTLWKFLMNKKVNRLWLDWTGKPNQFPEEGIFNGDPASPAMLTSKNGYYISWKLNEDGFYTDPIRQPYMN